MSKPTRGIAIMVLGLLVFTILNGVVKDQAQRFPVTEIIFFRNLFGLIPLLAAVPFIGGWRTLRPVNLPGHLIQAVAMSVTLICAYFAFATIPLAEATAIMFLQPVILVVIAHFFLKERASLTAWIAVFLGFAGVLFIARPMGLGFGPGTIAAIAGAFFAAVAIAQVRGLSATNSALTITTWYMVLGPAGLPPDVVTYLQQQVARALAAPDLKEKLKEAGVDVINGNAAEATAFLHAEQKKWAERIKASGTVIE